MSPSFVAAEKMPPLLPARFRTPPGRDGSAPSAATLDLVKSQVDALLSSTASFHDLPELDRRKIARSVTDIASYAAECARDVYWQSAKLQQQPVLRHRESVIGPVATSQADEFNPKAVDQIARVTQDTLKAVAFPAFVADLIKGTFNAIIQANTQQLDAFQKLLENVQKTVDQFMDDNISDNQARDWLQASFPDHIQVQGGKASARDGADEKPSHFKEGLHLDDEPSLDDDSIESVLVPAARRRLAETRLQMLSTMVLMGINRIVITGGKIRATMGFHIDATDRAHQEHASDVDFRVAAAGSFGFGPWSVSASTSFAYVTSTRSNSDDQIHVDTDLTGEVELHFKSDYLPVERFLGSAGINTIRGNTPVPENNALNAPFSAQPAVGNTVTPYKSPYTSPQPTGTTTLPPLGTLPPAPRPPTAPTAPKVDRHVDDPKKPDPAKQGDAAKKADAAKPPDAKQGSAGLPDQKTDKAAPPADKTGAPADKTPPPNAKAGNDGGKAAPNAGAAAPPANPDAKAPVNTKTQPAADSGGSDDDSVPAAVTSEALGSDDWRQPHLPGRPYSDWQPGYAHAREAREI